MSDKDLSLPAPEHTQDPRSAADDVAPDRGKPEEQGSAKFLSALPPFWHDRLIEGGLILSMALYCVIGNTYLGAGGLFHVNPLISLPFLLIFVVLCWYRLPFAVALLPLALPYYLLPKQLVGFSHFALSPAELTLWVCLGVALLQIVVQRGHWPYRLSWQELRGRLGPFTIPILVFLLAAGVSIMIAYNRTFALRAFRQQVLDPLLYLLLALHCLRSRQHVTRLLAALLGSALMVALLGIGQYVFFRKQLVLEADNIRRVHATYGSANSIGLFFDYTVPLGLALIVAQGHRIHSMLGTWWFRLSAIVLSLPLLLVLYLSQSGGAWIAVAVAMLVIIACSIRDRRMLLIGGVVLIIALGGLLLVFRKPIIQFVVERHVSAQGVSTVTKRLYLWQSALNMVKDSPILGYGMDNWLCHYSNNQVCYTPGMHHYWITQIPGTNTPTGLRDEPDLSHPHNIFLHVWVSIGAFGLLAFLAVLVLFFWLFIRMLARLRSPGDADDPHLQWMTVGVGAAMVAAVVQGQVDSSFLEQDLAFCFWMLVTALLLLRVLSKTPWQGRLHMEQSAA